MARLYLGRIPLDRPPEKRVNLAELFDTRAAPTLPNFLDGRKTGIPQHLGGSH